MEEIREAALTASAAARPKLLEMLDSEAFRGRLRDCCAASGIAEWPAERLLGTLHENVNSAELVHNFENSHSGLTLEVLLNNVTDYLPTSWQMIYLGYYGPVLPSFGHPSSPADASEEGVYRLQPFSQPHDLPGSYEEASGRAQYVALNMLRVDTGNPAFGNVTAVMSPSYWDAIAAAPVDTGLYTFKCNETYMNTSGSRHIPMKVPIECADITPGVAGAMDHALLNNQLMWSKLDVLGHLFSRWYGRNETYTNISSPHIMTYIESNILANVHFEDHGIKLLVGAFAPLFGTPRGQLLQQVAQRKGIALAWALGEGVVHMSMDSMNKTKPWRSGARMLDLTVAEPAGLNVSVSAASRAAFEGLWKSVAAERGPAGELSQVKARSLWASMVAEIPAGQVSVPAPGVCSDWSRCIGAAPHGECVCYRSERLEGFFV